MPENPVPDYCIRTVPFKVKIKIQNQFGKSSQKTRKPCCLSSIQHFVFGLEKSKNLSH
jgi:hypothetical protein